MSSNIDWNEVMKTLADRGYLPVKMQSEHRTESAFVPHAYDCYTVRSGGWILLASLDVAVPASDKDQLQIHFSALKNRIIRELGREEGFCMRHIATMATDMWAIQQAIEMIDAA